MGWFSYGAVAVVLALVVGAMIRTALRERQFERCFPVLQRLVAEQRYPEALRLLERTPGLRMQYLLPPDRAVQVADLETAALVGAGRVADAVRQLAHHLAARYVIGEWPADRFEQWLALYRRAGPLPVEEFYFCEVCGLDPETEALLQRAVACGCEPPAGYPGEHGSAVVVHLSSPQKVEPH